MTFEEKRRHVKINKTNELHWKQWNEELNRYIDNPSAYQVISEYERVKYEDINRRVLHGR